MLKAIFCDFYGTVVFEDDEPISMITEKIYQTGNAESKKEIGTYWWQCFSRLCMDSYGSGFRTQRELEIQSLTETLERFGSQEDAEKLSEPQFAYWKEPPIFTDSYTFFKDCPVPIFILSNIDTNDLNSALNFHKLQPAGIVTSEEARAYKPRREIFDFTLQKFGFEQNEVIHIGDSVTSDIVGAKAAGIQSIWINRKGKPTTAEVNRQTADLIKVLNILEDEI